MMTNLILERRFDPVMTPDEVMQLSIQSSGCFDMHRVEWHGSHLSLDGHKMICRFSAPDMESARIAMRTVRVDTGVLWRGTVHDRPGTDEQEIDTANVLVERNFEHPVTVQEIQDIEDAGIACLESRDVYFLRSYFAEDRKRMICLYRAPDAESVRQSQREAGVPFSDAWSFRAVGP